MLLSTIWIILNTSMKKGGILTQLPPMALLRWAGLLLATGMVVSSILGWYLELDSPTNRIIIVGCTVVLGLIVYLLSRGEAREKQALAKSREAEIIQRERVMAIINNMSEAVISTDERGMIQTYNAASLNLLDTNLNLTGKQFDEAIALQTITGKRYRLPLAHDSISHPDLRDDLILHQRDETVTIELTRLPIRSALRSHLKSTPRTNGYVFILRDITRAKSLETEKDEFISVVSHELRTPITIAEATLSNLELALSRRDIPSSQLKSYIDDAHEQIIYLARIVNDLSTLSRAERGTDDTPEEIDVSEMVHDLYHEYCPRAERAGLRLDLELAPQLGTVHASRLYLKELLQNFLTNAIKYTRVGTITIIVARTQHGVSFAIKDTGIGIAKSEQAKIFDKFYRSEDYRTRETRGTGLGLYVAAKLAHKLGTRITLTSRLNHGSTFRFVLVDRSADK